VVEQVMLSFEGKVLRKGNIEGGLFMGAKSKEKLE